MNGSGGAGFAAIRAQWTKNATKFGSPLPGRSNNAGVSPTKTNQHNKEGIKDKSQQDGADDLLNAAPWKQRRHSYAPSKIKTALNDDAAETRAAGPSTASPSKNIRGTQRHITATNSSPSRFPARRATHASRALDDDVRAFLSAASEKDLEDPSESSPPASRLTSSPPASSPGSRRRFVATIGDLSQHSTGADEASYRTDDGNDPDATETSRTEAGENSDGAAIREVRRCIIKKKKKKKKKKPSSSSDLGLSSSSHHSTRSAYTMRDDSSHRSSYNDDDFANDLTETSRTEGYGSEGVIREVKAPKKKKSSDGTKKKKARKVKKQGFDEEKKSDSGVISKPLPVIVTSPPMILKPAPLNTNQRVQSSSRPKQGQIFSMNVTKSKPKLPHFSHSDHAQDCILQALYNTESLTATKVGQLTQLLSAFEPFQYPAGEIIVDEGDNPEYFFVMDSGLVEITIQEEHVRTASAGDSFGELALLYDTRCAMTVLALEDCRVFRVDKQSFRTLLSADARRCVQKKLRLLQGIRFLDHLSTSELRCISEAMSPRMYKPGDPILDQNDYGNAFYVVADGQVFLGKKEGATFKSGDYFGQEAFVVNQKLSGSYRASTMCLAFSFAKHHFIHLLDQLSTCILTDKNVRSLTAIACLKDYDVKTLATHLKEKRFYDKEKIMVEKETTKAALYIIREGSVILSKSGSIPRRVGVGAWFGEAIMEKALEKSRKTVKSAYSISAEEGCVCAVLNVKDVLSITSSGESDDDVSVSGGAIAPSHFPIPKLDELTKHSVLGQGAFGQVWLTSDQSKQRAFALKIQSKSFLVEENQVEVVIQEKIMLDNLKHPFLINLFSTYQDSKYIYFLMDYVQGGELFSLMHGGNGCLPEAQTLFYSLSLADVLSYLHRDLKPENVMIDSRGFVKLIDFGFCKYLIEENTYTLCGTPGYLAPEVVALTGHNHGADHWALGILVFEMLFGYSPFYYDGVEQGELFESIVDNPVEIPDTAGKHAKDFLTKLLEKDPQLRLGAKDESAIMNHRWFKDLDAKALRNKRVTPPWQPKVSGLFDASNFSPDDSEIHDLAGKALQDRDAKLFEGLF